ncbi:MAG: helix-turn-helix transcriptional regulator [Desulfuromonadaceae bacterium]|nr:helix-turn-helix transcriptional regulator [Desulfuromonadaceae bacterium]
MKRPSNEKISQMREELFSRIDAGTISIGEATRMMRRTLGMNRRDYAEKILKISHDALQAVETGKGNPTLKTLKRIGKPFGLEVGFVRSKGHASMKHIGLSGP